MSSAVAITPAATISELAPAGSADYVALTAALALLAGLVFGLALVITVKQIPKLPAALAVLVVSLVA